MRSEKGALRKLLSDKDLVQYTAIGLCCKVNTSSGKFQYSTMNIASNSGEFLIKTEGFKKDVHPCVSGRLKMFVDIFGPVINRFLCRGLSSSTI